MNPNWKKTIDDEWITTGGGFDYFITFFRNVKNPMRQVEIFQDSDVNRKRGNEFGVNIGTLPQKRNNKYEFIQGDYIDAKGFKSKAKAFAFARNWMKKHPNG